VHAGQPFRTVRRPRLRWLVAALAALVAFSVPALLFLAWERSRLPGSYHVTDLGAADFGGGEHAGHAGQHAGHGRVDVEHLREAALGEPDYRRTLTARRASLTLSSGRQVEVLTFDGKTPGPELRIRQGDLVEITLVNEDVEEGVTIHWHGVRVPNAADGVAGVTQDAVMPGERYVYRFRAKHAGTYWYHSHQASARQVKEGLYGAFVVLPREQAATAEEEADERLDLVLMAHVFSGRDVLGLSDELERRAVDPGTDVRLRLVNTDDFPKRFTFAGAPFRVLAIDGVDLNEPTELTNTRLSLAAGGRFDLGFTMPDGSVRLDLAGADAGLLLSPDGRGTLEPAAGGTLFDPATYGSPAPTPFDASSRFDREFGLDIGDSIGFFDGRFGRHWTVNGETHEQMPALVVREGDLVRVKLSSRTRAVHPMHLHGHHVLVLSRNGEPTRGSPWWTDSLDLTKGDTFEVGFRADNPGLWMFHCHNLVHAAEGLGTHVVYEGVTTSYLVGGRTRNRPE
jgi:FtsP/CotA-like multicopper oxidase with cupredoxin domain